MYWYVCISSHVFVCVSQQCLHLMHNYNTLMAVVGGLCHSSISRLKDTTSHVPSEVTKVNDSYRSEIQPITEPKHLHVNHYKWFLFPPQVLNEMTDLLSSCRNYDNYRQAYNRCTGFKIPILGVHLKDLISVNEAMSDYVEDNKVNVQKLQALYNHINELIQLQQIPPKLDANKDLVHLLTVAHPSLQLLHFSSNHHVSSRDSLGCIERQHRCKWARYSMWIVRTPVCGRDESLWSMSVWVTNRVWMRVSSDSCIVVLSV